MNQNTYSKPTIYINDTEISNESDFDYIINEFNFRIWLVFVMSLYILYNVLKSSKYKNFSINNIDINIIIQKPKIKKYSKKMIQKISKICEINPNQINIKGRTTEKVGLIGKEKAIASEVIASIVKYD